MLRRFTSFILGAPILAAGLLLGTPNAADANLVKNGDFATGNLTDWTVTGGAPPVFFNATISGFDADFGTAGSAISQTIATTPGHTYEVQYLFLPSGPFGSGATQGTIGSFSLSFGSDKYVPEATWVPVAAGTPGCVTVGFPVACVLPNPSITTIPTADAWFFDGLFSESFADVAKSGLTTFGIAGSSCCGDLPITDIIVTDVTSVPEPASLALFGGGLVGLGLLRRRQKSMTA